MGAVLKEYSKQSGAFPVPQNREPTFLERPKKKKERAHGNDEKNISPSGGPREGRKASTMLSKREERIQVKGRRGGRTKKRKRKGQRGKNNRT